MIFFFQFNSKNFLRGRKFWWGVFKGARKGGFGVGRFKRGADLEHNQNELHSPILIISIYILDLINKI